MRLTIQSAANKNFGEREVTPHASQIKLNSMKPHLLIWYIQIDKFVNIVRFKKAQGTKTTHGLVPGEKLPSIMLF